VGEAAKKDDPELVPVGPGAEGLATDDEKLEHGDEKLRADERLGEGREEDEERPDRRETAKERRERQKRARNRERLERDFYMQRNEQLEKRLMLLESRTAKTEVASLDARTTTLQAQVAQAGRVMAEAMAKQDKESYNQALEIRDNLRDELAQLRAAKPNGAQQHQAPQLEQQQLVRSPAATDPRPDPIAATNAKAWAREHKWFDWNGTDEDSRAVYRLDSELAEEGYDPHSDEYWEELSARVKEELPHRFGKRLDSEDGDESDDDDMDVVKAPPRRPGPKGPKFSSGGRERPLKKGEVYISAERKEAMKMAGAWDDPVVRQRLLKRYAEMDRELAGSGQFAGRP
jgi:hypothetical protein